MPFDLWTWYHGLYIASPLVLAYALFRLTSRADYAEKRRLGLWLSSAAMVVLVVRNVTILLTEGFHAQVVPLQVCHFANIVLWLAFYLRSDKLFALSFCLNLPAAFISLVFANALAAYPSFWMLLAQTYFWGHLLIVMIALWAVLAGMVTIDRRVFGQTVMLMAGLFVGAMVLNNVLKLIPTLSEANYFYTVRPEEGTPLEWFYTLGVSGELGFFEYNVLYWTLTAMLGVVVVVLFYGLYVWLTRHVDVTAREARRA